MVEIGEVYYGEKIQGEPWLPNMGWEETSENRCAPTESYTSQIGLYREDIASYTETTTQALEQHGMVDGIQSCAHIE